ncbi:TonB-dependent receptor [Sediminicola luteus]|uniref:TonB-dependent receptor n=1 Tax=Sediminicola luteus TaxID=319238 RepID=A0A2A4G451_9FLAO|nr:TonB-dependent receptor [Sediminicola luteus]PCE62750.1 TonB-dependent receptor [Sediminicola luteus]
MKSIFTTMAMCGLVFSLNAQIQERDTTQQKQIELDEVSVSALRVNKITPVTFSNVEAEELESRNLGQDIPILLNYLPSVVTTSDAGAGIGYTGIRVRGSDATRVNVTVNGIPYNDPESQGTFWVNMPDFASSTESFQLQRGVGTSTNGAGAFGASLNLLTDAVSDEAYASISSSIGSFGTFRNNIKFSTGLLSDHIEISGRLSKINSDGYIDRATADLTSYFLQTAYKDENTLIKALLFGGHEITYQSWNGVSQAEIDEFGRTHNNAGAYTDTDGNAQFYDKEEDNYRQNHFQLHWNQQLSDYWKTQLAVHYTRGRGYFEQYKENQGFAGYNLAPITLGGETIDETDLIRRRWLDNHFYGTTFSAQYEKDGLSFVAGGAFNTYDGGHFGEIIWARYASGSEIRDRYYDNDSDKTDFNVYTKANYRLNQKWSLFGDLQYRRVGYKANGAETGNVDDTFNFFNPKAGVSYILNDEDTFYFSYARANREPNRNDYESGNPKPEKLNDFELGYRHNSQNLRMNANFYYMGYTDQLVLTGELNDVGAPLRENVGKSYRTGIELDVQWQLTDKWLWAPNLALSSNKNQDYVIDRDDNLQELGNTNIALSPQIIAGNLIQYSPIENLQLGLLTKYVGEQYLSNTDTDASKLDAYLVNDLNLTYTLRPSKIFKEITFSGLVNNLLDEKYISNGYTYLNTWSNPGNSFEVQGYYPQAGINFLLGATFHF